MSPHTQRFLDDEAVEIFAQQLKEKLAAARAKGRSGWQGCATEYLQAELLACIAKGDPLDVAAYCMFLVARNASMRIPAIGTGPACEHPEGCTHCNWCGFHADMLPPMPPAFKRETPPDSEPYGLFTVGQMVKYALAAMRMARNKEPDNG